MESSSVNLVDLLKNKDVKEEMPEGWEYVRNNKNAWLLQHEEGTLYEHKATAHCLKKCFKPSASTSVVNTQESECQTNCFAKALETRALFEYLNMKQDGKASIIL